MRRMWEIARLATNKLNRPTICVVCFSDVVLLPLSGRGGAVCDGHDPHIALDCKGTSKDGLLRVLLRHVDRAHNMSMNNGMGGVDTSGQTSMSPGGYSSRVRKACQLQRDPENMRMISSTKILAIVHCTKREECA